MIIAGTGHRPNKLGGYGDHVHHALFALAKTALQTHTPELVISGGALGWDTALAAAAAACEIPYIVAVPFKGQENMWPTPSKERYARMLERANKVITICEGGYSPDKMQIRNRWMVDNADTILALWDGTSGGTNNCVQYAIQQQKPIINLWDQWK